MFKDVIDSRIPSLLIKIRQHSLPWMNSEIRKAMNKQYKLLKFCDGTPEPRNTGRNINLLEIKLLFF